MNIPIAKLQLHCLVLLWLLLLTSCGFQLRGYNHSAVIHQPVILRSYDTFSPATTTVKKYAERRGIELTADLRRARGYISIKSERLERDDMTMRQNSGSPTELLRLTWEIEVQKRATIQLEWGNMVQRKITADAILAANLNQITVQATAEQAAMNTMRADLNRRLFMYLVDQ